MKIFLTLIVLAEYLLSVLLFENKAKVILHTISMSFLVVTYTKIYKDYSILWFAVSFSSVFCTTLFFDLILFLVQDFYLGICLQEILLWLLYCQAVISLTAVISNLYFGGEVETHNQLPLNTLNKISDSPPTYSEIFKLDNQPPKYHECIFV